MLTIKIMIIEFFINKPIVMVNMLTLCFDTIQPQCVAAPLKLIFKMNYT